MTIDVSAPAGTLQITTGSLPGGTNSKAYSATLAAAGGSAPYTWSLASGSLPPGLSLNGTTGNIAGTASQNGQFNFVAQVTDNSSPAQTASAPLTIVVSAPAGTLQITTGSLPDGTNSKAYSATLAAAGGSAPYTWSLASGSLPPGLSLNGTTGNITGTASQNGQFNFVAQVTDNSSPALTATAPLSITILGASGLDQYGGRTDIQCSTSGKWSTQKIANQWWFCTPSGNGFFLLAVDVVDQNGGSGYPTTVQAKYGGSQTWATETNK
ncbi:MAG TPA: putative Ig domain-containing protein, partial [Candidatus Acidoferrales bacterium]|nr:putative Ig domain-containing protein [Candidatus Acidoferrales bacterium]